MWRINRASGGRPGNATGRGGGSGRNGTGTTFTRAVIFASRARSAWVAAESAHSRAHSSSAPIPRWISHIAGRHGAAIGGVHVTADGRRAVVVSVLDNLLKGAATQAVQNLNLAFGLDEWTGIAMESTDD